MDQICFLDNCVQIVKTILSALTSSGSSLLLLRCSFLDPSCGDEGATGSGCCFGIYRNAVALQSLCLLPPLQRLLLLLLLRCHQCPGLQWLQQQSGCPPPGSSPSPGCPLGWNWTGQRWPCRLWRSRRQKPHWHCLLLSTVHRSADMKRKIDQYIFSSNPTTHVHDASEKAKPKSYILTINTSLTLVSPSIIMKC